jgi:phosphatidylethanolamine-binding protein (PEBP) family uncharacterized protein
VEQSGTEIVANDLTRSFYGGACPNKKEKPQSKNTTLRFLLVVTVTV